MRVVRVQKDDRKLREGRRVVTEEMRSVVGRGLRLKKEETWRLYWVGHKMKMIANVIRCEKGPVGWERRWASYVLREWRLETKVQNFDAQHLVYDVTTLHSRAEYADQTGNGTRKRRTGHLRRAARRRQKWRFYRFLARVRLHKAIFTPLHMFGNRLVKVYERMRVEGRVIANDKIVVGVAWR